MGPLIDFRAIQALWELPTFPRVWPGSSHSPGVRDNPIHRIVPDGIELADGTVRLNILLTYRWLDGVPARTPPGRANSVY